MAAGTSAAAPESFPPDEADPEVPLVVADAPPELEDEQLATVIAKATVAMTDVDVDLAIRSRVDLAWWRFMVSSFGCPEPGTGGAPATMGLRLEVKSW
ncbi:MAG: hypothetical protein M3Y49_08750 [Actinomycetota bacterium]|nr:hypothetical protein [Actinomycetota bacterium]